MPVRIVIVESEPALAPLIRDDFEAIGYHVDTVGHAEAEIRMRESAPDLVILDDPLSETPNGELCERIRTYAGSIPAPIITLVDRDDDGLRVLDAGADDFVLKPVSTPHLLARVRALLRRVKPQSISQRLQVADVELNREHHRAIRAGRELQLGPTEFRLLEVLIASPGKVFSREQLLAAVWGPKAHTDERTVDVYVGRLRRTLKIGNRKDLIMTVRGTGYALKAPVDEVS